MSSLSGKQIRKVSYQACTQEQDVRENLETNNEIMPQNTVAAAGTIEILIVAVDIMNLVIRDHGNSKRYFWSDLRWDRAGQVWRQKEQNK